MSEAVLFEVHDGVATITLNRPEVLNALNDDLYRGLADAVSAVAADSGIRCAILTGAGRAFCAGADVTGMDPARKLMDRRHRHRWILSTVLRPLAQVEKPVIAAVNGPAVGAGMNIALAA